jgi:acetoin utilization deacetylase AcuC-like enzyme
MFVDHHRIRPPLPASRDQLLEFHSEEYIQHLEEASGKRKAKGSKRREALAEEFGLRYDCDPFPGVFKYAASVAGRVVSLLLLFPLPPPACDSRGEPCGGGGAATRL